MSERFWNGGHDQAALDEIWRRGPLSHLPRPSAQRQVLSVFYDQMEILDTTGPISVFDNANKNVRRHYGEMFVPYRCKSVALCAGEIRTSSGIALVADHSFDDSIIEIDTLIVPGGPGTRDAAGNSALVASLRKLAMKSRRASSVCSGAYVLAATGLLDGRKASTHWMYCDRIREKYPKVEVEPDSIFTRDGKYYSSAGITAGIDLALAMVEEDLGRGWALLVAREMVVYMRRPGGQSQFSAPLQAQFHDADKLNGIPNWIVQNLSEDLSVWALARRAAMSERNFARRFKEVMGVTPAKFVETARLEAARRRLEESDATLASLAAEVGFGDGERLRRAFNRQYGVNPDFYRNRFGRNAHMVDELCRSRPE